MIKELYNNKSTLGSEGSLIAQEALELVEGLKKGYGVTTRWNTPDTLAYQLMEYNIFEFSESKTEARLAAMTNLLIDREKQQIRSFNDFRTLALEEVKEFNDNWLETEYNLSISVGQNAAAYQRFMSEKDTVTSFVQYQTAGDSAVRDEHALLNGVVFNLSDREAMKLWPPNGYGCRCEMVQYIGETEGEVMPGETAQKMLDKDSGKWSKSQFNINRGDLKEVFTKQQFYSDIKGMPEKLNQMTFDKYNLSKWDSFKSNLNPIKIDDTITSENVNDFFKKKGKETFMRFTDYFDRKMVLQESNFKKHTKGKYLNKQENRHRLFPHLNDILKNPNEVWYNNPDKSQGKFQSRYVKFYNDMVVVVDCETTGKGLEIRSWYQAKKEDLNYRKGLLIRNTIK